MDAPSGSASSRLRADARANRDAIIEAAARLYSERRPPVPAADVAKAAGVGRATLARRFPTADTLRLAVLERLVEGLEERAADLPAEPGSLRTLLERSIDLFSENAPLVELLRSRPGAIAGAEPLLERIRGLVAGPLGRARAAGIVHDDVVPEDIRLVLFMVSSAEQNAVGLDARERSTRLVFRALGMTDA